jgi:nucleotide-binding universal stress UspA family protein
MVVYVLYMTIEPVRTWYHDMRAAPALLAAAKQTRNEAQYYFSETVDTEILLRDYADPDILRIARRYARPLALIVKIGKRSLRLHGDDVAARPH